jgi:hypothetical protein
MLGGRRIVKEIGRSNKTSNNSNINSNNGSTPTKYSHIAAMSRNILSIEQGPELDFSDDFEDSRLELKSTGIISFLLL